MDRVTIRTEARRQLNEPTSGGFWSNTLFDTVINKAIDDIAIKTKCLKTYAEFTSSSTVCEYDFSEASLANFVDIAEVWFFTGTTTYEVLISITRDELALVQSQMRGTVGTPSFYCYEDRVLEFDCNPTDAMTVRVYYYKTPAALDSDDDVPTIPTKFHDAIVTYVCWKFSEADDLDERRTAYFKTIYEQELAKLREIIKTPASTYPAIQDDTQVPYSGR